MAKTYATSFQALLEKQYATGITPLLAISKLNQGVTWRALPIQGSETETGNIQVSIQRLKRLKSEPTVQTDGNKAGANFIARLDKAIRADWVTITTVAINKRDFIIRFADAQNMDITTEKGKNAYQWLINQALKGDLVFYEQEAEKRLIGADTTASKPKLVYTGDLAEAQEVVKTVMLQAKGLQLLVDEFKAYLDATEIGGLIHPIIANAFSIVQGQSYQTGTNTFPKGLGKSFRYDGIEFYESPLLNSIEGDAATEVIGVVLFDKGAYADAGFELNFKSFTPTKLLDENIAGHSYGELSVVIDAKRIKVLEYTLPTGITKSEDVMA